VPNVVLRRSGETTFPFGVRPDCPPSIPASAAMRHAARGIPRVRLRSSSGASPSRSVSFCPPLRSGDTCPRVVTSWTGSITVQPSSSVARRRWWSPGSAMELSVEDGPLHRAGTRLVRTRLCAARGAELRLRRAARQIEALTGYDGTISAALDGTTPSSICSSSMS
jgi:hypothetical protein